jgi:hypothetical protein
MTHNASVFFSLLLHSLLTLVFMLSHAIMPYSVRVRNKDKALRKSSHFSECLQHLR